MGTIRRTAVAATLLAATALTRPADAAPITLAGVTYIHGAEAAYADVRLPKSVTLSTPFGGGDDLAVAGQARFAAFVLVGTDARTRGVIVAGGETNTAGHSATFLMPVPEGAGGGTFEESKTFGDATQLPAGAYRVYALVEGGPATFVLRLRGLTGSASVRPVRAANGSIGHLDDAAATRGVPRTAFAATAEDAVGTRGFALQALHTHLEAEAAWQVVMCHYDAAEVTVRGTPGCPEGRNHTVATRRSPSATAADRLFVQAFAGLPKGEHGLSTVYTSESVTTAVAYSALWLSY